MNSPLPKFVPPHPYRLHFLLLASPIHVLKLYNVNFIISSICIILFILCRSISVYDFIWISGLYLNLKFIFGLRVYCLVFKIQYLESEDIVGIRIRFTMQDLRLGYYFGDIEYNTSKLSNHLLGQSWNCYMLVFNLKSLIFLYTYFTVHILNKYVPPPYNFCAYGL